MTTVVASLESTTCNPHVPHTSTTARLAKFRSKGNTSFPSPPTPYHTLPFLLSCDHITDTLISLHWLWVPERILYKTAVLTYKALHGGAPRYLSSLVHVANVPGRQALRSAGSNRLQIPPLKLSSVGGRAFPVAAAQFWNRFPDNISSANLLSAFQQQLEHTLFQQSFPDIIL